MTELQIQNIPNEQTFKGCCPVQQVGNEALVAALFKH